MFTHSARASTILVLVSLSLCCSAVLAGDFGILLRGVPPDPKPKVAPKPPVKPLRALTPEEIAEYARQDAEFAAHQAAQAKSAADERQQWMLKGFEPITSASLVGFEAKPRQAEGNPYNYQGTIWPHDCLLKCALSPPGTCKSVVYDQPAKACYLHDGNRATASLVRGYSSYTYFEMAQDLTRGGLPYQVQPPPFGPRLPPGFSLEEHQKAKRSSIAVAGYARTTNAALEGAKLREAPNMSVYMCATWCNNSYGCTSFAIDWSDGKCELGGAGSKAAPMSTAYDSNPRDYFVRTEPRSPSASGPAAPSNVRIIGGETVATPPKVAATSPVTTTQTSAASPCRARMSEPNKWKKNEVQKFDDALLTDLCEKQEQSTGPADCFQYVMSGQVAWDMGPPPRVNWQPANALKLCKMTPHGTVTAQCFQTLLARKTPWAEAIESCRVTDPSGARVASATPAATSPTPGPAPGASAAATGRTVTVVEIGQPGRKQGEFRQTAPKQWAEINPAGAVVFRFEETQRDDGSVYLVDRSRGVNLQLDLSTRKVMYSDAGSKPRALYDITTAR